MNPNSPESRTAFERYIKSNGSSTIKAKDGAYRNLGVAIAWGTWRAAIACILKRQRQPPKTPAQIADRLDDLSQRMLICGTAMQAHDGPIGEHGAEMIGAARYAQGWADGIRAQLEIDT